MIFEEEHGRDDDVAGGNVRLAPREAGGVAVPVGGGVERDFDARPFAGELRGGALDRSREMVVEGDDHHPDFWGEATVHNALSRHKVCRA